MSVVNARAALYEVLDERFRSGRCALGDRQLEILHRGSRWAEGPLYLPAARSLVWSDIPNDRLLRWDETTGEVGVFRSPAGHPNGNTLDGQGRLVTCEQGNRRVTRTEHDGSVTVLADRYRGKRLNSPNDAAVRSDGSIWFSDPEFGIASDYEGHRGESEIGARDVYRIDPDTGEVRLVADGFSGPNGLVFSPDESRLFVSDSIANHIRVFDVREDGTLSEGDVFVSCTKGNFDNIRFDDAGRLWAAAMEGGVHCYHPDGTLLGRLLVPETVANIRFGGPRRNRLFIAGTTTIYSLLMSVTGLPPLPGVHQTRPVGD
ncbi:SMP-30/gluconolactonase/LRE family protein [Streptomyces sp. 3MP-14]|uniref:SMP-30/gluconolactonase/LRE family protein n=1 Tax=Streptomyces mimosae TaxID=2586635 RepID=A0A5N6A4R8_9ACTN|nr:MULTISPECIES: SMP-30/gluconolactonase/LRE family protein [Streptomyces]KAB8163787.1 SMP-30/gluconolactonase/LRE family protein [Streptomyces mimosae]KAB8175230.1 SMP-30/gluconolactonase/LRE family protein [Streptomyces sp. 3MP-14]